MSERRGRGGREAQRRGAFLRGCLIARSTRRSDEPGSHNGAVAGGPVATYSTHGAPAFAAQPVVGTLGPRRVATLAIHRTQPLTHASPITEQLGGVTRGARRSSGLKSGARAAGGRRARALAALLACDPGLLAATSTTPARITVDSATTSTALTDGSVALAGVGIQAHPAWQRARRRLLSCRCAHGRDICGATSRRGSHERDRDRGRDRELPRRLDVRAAL